MKRNLHIRLIIACLLIAGCTAIHEVNLDGIDRNKNKTFHIGFVKVAGRLSFTDNVEKKKEALRKIEIDKIINTLNDYYEFNIKAESDYTIKTIKETIDGSGQTSGHPTSSGISYQISFASLSENPYFGYKEYLQHNGLFSEPTLRQKDEGNMVYITYSFEAGRPGFPQKDKFYYDIIIKSDSDILVHHKDIVAINDSPQMGFFDNETTWNNLVLNAGLIDEKLSEDLRTKK